MGKFITIIISIFYLIMGYFLFGLGGIFAAMILLIFPLMCIWYPDRFGDYIGPNRIGRGSGGYITEKSPAFLVKFLGWILLLIPLIAGIYIAKAVNTR